MGILKHIYSMKVMLIYSNSCFLCRNQSKPF